MDTGPTAQAPAAGDAGQGILQQEASASDSTTSATKLFLGGLSWSTTEDTLKDRFSQYGAVDEVVVMRDRATSKPRGFGFIVFAEPEAARAAMEQGPHLIDGRLIDPKPSIPIGQQPPDTTHRKVFVGGLPPHCTEDEFRDYFSRFGPVEEAQIMIDPLSQRSRGFGFVTFEDEAAVQRAFGAGPLHELAGATVEVKTATPKGSGPQQQHHAAAVLVPRQGAYHQPVAGGFASPATPLVHHPGAPAYLVQTPGGAPAGFARVLAPSGTAAGAVQAHQPQPYTVFGSPPGAPGGPGVMVMVPAGALARGDAGRAALPVTATGPGARAVGFPVPSAAQGAPYGPAHYVATGYGYAAVYPGPYGPAAALPYAPSGTSPPGPAPHAVAGSPPYRQLPLHHPGIAPSQAAARTPLQPPAGTFSSPPQMMVPARPGPGAALGDPMQGLGSPTTPPYAAPASFAATPAPGHPAGPSILHAPGRTGRPQHPAGALQVPGGSTQPPVPSPQQQPLAPQQFFSPQQESPEHQQQQQQQQQQHRQYHAHPMHHHPQHLQEGLAPGVGGEPRAAGAMGRAAAGAGGGARSQPGAASGTSAQDVRQQAGGQPHPQRR